MEFNSNASSYGNSDTIPFSWFDSDSTDASDSAVVVPTSHLKQQTKFGVFLWWSEQTPPWVHPDDVDIATALVPGDRIFCREECENDSDRKLGYSKFRYGRESFRGKSALWLEVDNHGFEIGDLIEIKSQSGKLRPQIALIAAIKWNRKSLSIEYFVSVNGTPLGRAFSNEEIQPAIRLGKHLSSRELRLASR